MDLGAFLGDLDVDQWLEDMPESDDEGEREPRYGERSAARKKEPDPMYTERMDFCIYFGCEDIKCVMEKFSDAEIAARAGDEGMAINGEDWW